jgi:hypothetical protein
MVKIYLQRLNEGNNEYHISEFKDNRDDLTFA